MQRVTAALKSCTPLEARLDPEWRLVVTGTEGRMAVGVRKASDADDARNASRRNKGVTLTSDEWLSLASVVPKIKSCLHSMKSRRRKKE